MLHIPIFIIGGCAALAINQFFNKKELTQSEKAINVKKESDKKEVSRETIDNQNASTRDSIGDSGGDNNEATSEKPNNLGDIPNVD